jgi:hypothetical protein
MRRLNIEMCCVTDSSTKAYYQFVRENYNRPNCRPNCDNSQVKQSEQLLIRIKVIDVASFVYPGKH